MVQKVVGSNPIIHPNGPVPKWFKGVDCKSIIRWFESNRDLKIARWCNGNTSVFGADILGSNPSRVTKLYFDISLVH